MAAWSKPRLEGRALEHCLVAWLRSQRQGAAFCRPRVIRMLRADGSVDLVDDPLILNNMKYYASELVKGLCKVARFSSSFAEQTAYNGQHSISLDIRGLFEKQEAWLEMKWTRSDLRSALALTKPRVTEFHNIAVERKALVLHTCLGGKKLPQPHFIGGLAVNPDGWLLELLDLTSGKKETWKGFFDSSPAHLAPSKAIAPRGPQVKRTITPAGARQAQLQKHKRYNESAKGLERSKRQGDNPARATYLREYGLTDHGRAKRAQARAAYKARQKLCKRPSQNNILRNSATRCRCATTSTHPAFRSLRDGSGDLISAPSPLFSSLAKDI